MALSLARDKLNYSPAQLDDLSIKLRHGDLTPILQIYEKDIKNPVRSAISGTLLRTVFVQVQKAKVRAFRRPPH
jgi:nuclear-control-of-ATPase protein 2